ncbi:hypothetical protein [Kineosporia sp. A_224]|uniref:hypothetical protein n=1 Tax=Kineosporia sp. A_224 TaxID=1962180 RepID=UPI00117A7643|nr:hypothetical protein [Kineosporia sp. A_224]
MRWQLTVACWDATAARQNTIPTDAEHTGDVLLIGVENQGVWLWGLRDQMVVERENEAHALWTSTGESLLEYLWHFLLFETVLTSDRCLVVNDATLDQHRRFFDGWERLMVKPWRWPGPLHALWYRDGALALSFAEELPGDLVGPDTTVAILVAGRTGEALARIDRLDLPWDVDSAKD